MSRVGLSRVCLSRVGYGTVPISSTRGRDSNISETRIRQHTESQIDKILKFYFIDSVNFQFQGMS